MKNLATTCVLASLILATAGCSRLYRFSGIIVNGDGVPVTGASIALRPHDWDRSTLRHSREESGEDGKFKATWGSAVGVEYFRITIYANGYRESEQLIKADQKDIRFVLEREPELAPLRPGLANVR